MMWCLLSLWNVMYVMESECFDSFSFLSWSMLNKFLVFMRLSTWRLFVAVVSQLNLRLFIVQGH